MDIILSNTSKTPIYEQIKDQIKQAILNGELKAGEAMPSIRGLAKDLRVSVITTKRAYEDLEKEGFINTVVGKGSFVSGQSEDWLREQRLRKVENHLEAAADEAHALGLSFQELCEMLDLFYRGDR